MSRVERLPPVVGAAFLAKNGILGYRCPCRFVASGRTLAALQAAILDHEAGVHLQSDLAVDDTGASDE